MRKEYPATKTGLRRLGRDMQKEIEKNVNPVTVPVRYQYAPAPYGVTAAPAPSGAPTVNHHHYGDVYSIGGSNINVAVGNQGPVDQSISEQAANQWRMALLAALGNVQNRLDELPLDPDDRDTIDDAATSAATIASNHGDDGDDEVDDTALRRRGRKVLQILETVMAGTASGLLARELADPLAQLLS